MYFLDQYIGKLLMFSLHLQGCGPTVARAVVVNAAQLSSYSQAKQFVLGTGKYIITGYICDLLSASNGEV